MTYQPYLDFLEQREKEDLLRVLPKAKNKAGWLDFSSNDTFNLALDPALLEASRAYAVRGTSSSGSRLLCEHQTLFEEVEQTIAQLKGTETALLFASGFQANLSVIAALLDRTILKKEPLVFTDKLIHASMHQGCQLAGVKQIRFKHQDLTHLAERLEDYKHSDQPRFILVESLYSMEGTVTHLNKLTELAKQYKAFLYVDEAHATGLYGHEGGGFTKAYANQIDCVLGNFGKALGSFGGFIACSHDLKRYLINRCEGLIYSTALPPMLLGAQKAALDLLKKYEPERQRLHALSRFCKYRLQQVPFEITLSESHIFGILIPDQTVAEHVIDKLNTNKISASWIRPPTVPKHRARIRISLKAHHTEKDIDRLIEVLCES